jgi:hypothetical protein
MCSDLLKSATDRFHCRWLGGLQQLAHRPPARSDLGPGPLRIMLPADFPDPRSCGRPARAGGCSRAETIMHASHSRDGGSTGEIALSLSSFLALIRVAA